MLQQFKSFDTDRMDLDDLVEMVAFGESLRAQYEKLGLEEPDFVDHQLKGLKRDIRAKNSERVASRLKEVKARLDALKTPSQRKTELEKERKQLEAQLQEV